MRSPVIAFSILAAAAAVSGAPTSPNLDKAIADASKTHVIRQLDAVTGALSPLTNMVQSGGAAAASAPKTKSKADANDPVSRTQAMRQADLAAQQPSTDGKPAMAKKMRRAGDSGTAGGNAYSGAAQSADGGDVYQEADADTGVIANDATSNNAGGGGDSFSGFATGGNGGGHGPGGNAYTGATSSATGGNIENYADGPDVTEDDVTTPAITNAGGNNAGGGGFSESGTARGGNAAGAIGTPPTLDRRAGDAGTAGGNAYSGATQDVSGGSIVNEADDQDGSIENTGGNAAGGAGTTFSGDAIAGDGDGYGPGGNAYSGASGPSDGGFVYNDGGAIANDGGDGVDTNTGGGGGVSQTGDARGGNA